MARMRTRRGRAAICRVWRMITENSQPKNDSDSAPKTKTRTEIHVETHEVLVIRSLSQPGVAWCEACGVELRIPVDDAPAAPQEKEASGAI